MRETFCVFCGSKMNWENNYPYGELFEADEDDNRIVVVMCCPECGCEADFIQPPEDDDD